MTTWREILQHLPFIVVHSFYFSAILNKLALSQDVCNGVGSQTEAFTASNARMFYLNTARPALCNGTIAQLYYCYHGFNSTRSTLYTATVALYRPESDRNYTRISDTVNITISPLLTGFNCESYHLDTEIEVQENDVIGACLYDADDNSSRALRLVSRFTENGYSMMTASVTAVGCSTGVLPDVVGNLEPGSSKRILHIYAEITTPSPTDSEPTGKIGVIGGTVGGALLLIALFMVTVVIITAVVVKIRKRRKRVDLRNHSSHSRSVPIRYYRKASFDKRVETSNHTRSDTHSQPTHKDEDNGSTELAHIYQYATSELHFTSDGQEMTTEIDEHFYFVLEGPKCPYSELLEKNKEEDIYASVAKYEEPASKVGDLYAQIKSFNLRNIDRSSIEVQSHLGSGEFGSVKSGFWRTRKFEIKIAIKTLNRRSKTKSRVRFLQEAAIMAQFRHPNITSLFGVVSKGEPLMLVVELVEKGDLRRYLQQIKPASAADESSIDLPSKLLSYSRQVSLGMQYLSGKGFVHRDLAARNVLVSKDDYCKIADFGMSRDLANEKYYVSRGGQIPVKWTALEAIHYKKYSTASDVWSYGCLLYEIWSLGHMPFETTENFEVIDRLERGIRLAPPPGCPRTIYETMIMCWNPTTDMRPNFREITLALTGRETDILHIPKEVYEAHQQAGDLGSPLEAGEDVYIDLQQTYYV